MSECAPPRVVVIEDDPDTITVLEHLLTDLGLQLIACPPTLALACIETTRPQLVVLDVRLGTQDGIAIFHQLRAQGSTSAVPVIFFTANTAKVHSRLPRYADLGAVLVSKPNITQLIAALQAMLPHRGADAAAGDAKASAA
jgi:CheY-like chemotaxis protein